MSTAWKITPFWTTATNIKFSSESMSVCSAMVSCILYLSAPGADISGTAPWLSNKSLSSVVVTMSSTTLNPKFVSTLSEYFDIIFDWSSVNTKWPLA